MKSPDFRYGALQFSTMHPLLSYLFRLLALGNTALHGLFLVHIHHYCPGSQIILVLVRDNRLLGRVLSSMLSYPSAGTAHRRHYIVVSGPSGPGDIMSAILLGSFLQLSHSELSPKTMERQSVSTGLSAALLTNQIAACSVEALRR